MQAQSTRTEVATTSAQSLLAIQTLLKASLGCITFLRDLLPSDNFTDSHFTSSDDSPSFLSQSSDSNLSIDSTRSSGRSVNGFRIMTMTRGYTHEADRILNYLEYGIFDALQKSYLRSFVFAIYLDEKDPNNIIEAYTFNFHYHKVPGTDTVIPMMSIGDSNKKQSPRDPITLAAKSGKAPTLKDVKKSVKTLLKTLIHSTTQMDVLPKRRFAAFKLYYTDETPAEYEPPHFLPGDATKDKWFFMTHDVDEVPDKWKLGQVETGHHFVNLSVASIATYLPSSTENDSATFTGTTSRPVAAPPLTPLEEAAARAEQAAKQIRDAESRNIVWSADSAVEGDDMDADGEDDPEYIANPDGTYRKRTEEDDLLPIGIRNEDGEIEPLLMRMEEAQFSGTSQEVPAGFREMNALQKLDTTNMEQTQPCTDANCLSPFRDESLPPSDVPTSSTMADEADLDTQVDIDTQMLQQLALDNQQMTEDGEMLDMETQVNPAESMDPIQSFDDVAMVDRIEEDMPTPTPAPKKRKDVMDRGLQCECDVTIEDYICFCEECGRWYHVWCMGYHSTDDRRLPEEFICFDCRVRADNSWELIKVDLYPKMLSKFKDLALFRRAIKVVENHNPNVLADFARVVGCDNILARQLFKRLENEGFIVEQSMEMDDLGFVETRSKAAKGKSKGKQPKQRKNVQKSRYTFNRACLSTAEYSDYFDPSAESRLLDLPQKKSAVKARTTALPSLPPMTTMEESQTQQDTQLPMHIPPAPESQPEPVSILSKRPLTTTSSSETATPRPKKKVKISIAPAIDLAE